MSKSKHVLFFFRLAAIAPAILAASSAAAVVVDLAPPPATYAGQFYTGDWYGGGGGRRAFIFEDIAPFVLNSVGIETNLAGTSILTAGLYSVIGADTPGPLLATNSALLPDVGRDFYDIPLTYSFAGAGARYLLDISWALEPTEFVFYQFEGLGDFGEPIDPFYSSGPFRVIDGKDGGSLGDDNFIIAHFRADIAPEPSTLVLGAIGILVVGVGALRRMRG